MQVNNLTTWFGVCFWSLYMRPWRLVASLVVTPLSTKHSLSIGWKSLVANNSTFNSSKIVFGPSSFDNASCISLLAYHTCLWPLNVWKPKIKKNMSPTFIKFFLKHLLKAMPLYYILVYKHKVVWKLPFLQPLTLPHDN